MWGHIPKILHSKMGRRKADIPTGKFKLRTDQKKCGCKDKCKCKFPVYLEYASNRKFAKTTTEFRFTVSEWDDTNQKVKGTIENYNRINKQLSKLKNTIDGTILDYFACFYP